MHWECCRQSTWISLRRRSTRLTPQSSVPSHHEGDRSAARGERDTSCSDASRSYGRRGGIAAAVYRSSSGWQGERPQLRTVPRCGLWGITISRLSTWREEAEYGDTDDRDSERQLSAPRAAAVSQSVSPRGAPKGAPKCEESGRDVYCRCSDSCVGTPRPLTSHACDTVRFLAPIRIDGAPMAIPLAGRGADAGSKTRNTPRHFMIKGETHTHDRADSLTLDTR